MPKVFISAGEPSGDLHAAKLMHAIKQMNPEVEFVGIGGKEMQSTGFRSIVPLEEIAVVGFWEVAKKYSKFINLEKQCQSILKSEKIDLFIPVDYPGFNIRIAKYAKSLGIPIIYYIAPQLWAWGKNRAAKLASVTDELLTVFPFEEDFFRREGINAKFVGHPLLDIPELKDDFPTFQQRKDLLLLFPGSRKQEIHKHLDLLIDTADAFHSHEAKFDIAIVKSNNLSDALFSEKLRQHKFISLVQQDRQLMRSAKLGIIKSGTSNLEAMLFGMPFSMYYKTSPLTYYWGKKIINIEYLSIVNILANKPLIREFIQADATAEKLSTASLELLHAPEKYDTVQAEFRELKAMLGSSGASHNAAREAMKYL